MDQKSACLPICSTPLRRHSSHAMNGEKRQPAKGIRQPRQQRGTCWQDPLAFSGSKSITLATQTRSLVSIPNIILPFERGRTAAKKEKALEQREEQVEIQGGGNWGLLRDHTYRHNDSILKTCKDMVWGDDSVGQVLVTQA